MTACALHMVPRMLTSRLCAYHIRLQVLEADPDNIKGLFRRAQGHMAQQVGPGQVWTHRRVRKSFLSPDLACLQGWLAVLGLGSLALCCAAALCSLMGTLAGDARDELCVFT